MPAPNINTFNLTPPRRPTLADFNAAKKQDDAASPPNVVTMPNAGEWNTMCFLLVAIGQVIATARVAVTAGGSPSISSVIAPGDAVNSNASAFILTRNGAGDYWVECASNDVLPNFTSQPGVTVNASSPTCLATAVYGTGPNTFPAIRVKTDVSGTPTDVDFAVDFF